MATEKEKVTERERIKPMETRLPTSVFTLLGDVSSGRKTMADAKQELRRWVAGLTEEEKEQLKVDVNRICQVMVLAAEGLSQELQTLTVSL
jgi:hypothetical protein